jgi:hypothetical protein
MKEQREFIEIWTEDSRTNFIAINLEIGIDFFHKLIAGHFQVDLNFLPTAIEKGEVKRMTINEFLTLNEPNFTVMNGQAGNAFITFDSDNCESKRCYLPNK